MFGAQLPVLIRLVVDHLILMAGRGRAVFSDQILDAIVAARADAPFPAQLEIVEGPLGNDVAAVFSADLLQNAVFNLPTPGRHGLSPVTAPSLERFAVEQRLPAIGAGLRPGAIQRNRVGQ